MPEFDMVLLSNPSSFDAFGAAMETAAGAVETLITDFQATTNEVGTTWKGEASGAHKNSANRKVEEYTKIVRSLTSGSQAAISGGAEMQALATQLRIEVEMALEFGYLVIPGGEVVLGPAQLAEASAAGPGAPEVIAAFEEGAMVFMANFRAVLTELTVADQATATRLREVGAEFSTVQPALGANARPSVADDPYQRPGFRDGIRDRVWRDAEQNSPDGIVRDPLTDEPMDPNDPWDMGHRPGYEFRKHRAQAEINQPTRQRYVNEYNDPDHYRPEMPPSNQGHGDEAGDEVDHWADYYQNNPVTRRR